MRKDPVVQTPTTTPPPSARVIPEFVYTLPATVGGFLLLVAAEPLLERVVPPWLAGAISLAAAVLAIAGLRRLWMWESRWMSARRIWPAATLGAIALAANPGRDQLLSIGVGIGASALWVIIVSMTLHTITLANNDPHN
jgi:hypothetical protein